MDTVYSPEAPVIKNGQISADLLLTNPARIQRKTASMANERMLSPQIFSQGSPATGGAVVYDRMLGSLYPDRRAQAIEPLAEFPLLTAADVTPEVAAAVKYGAAFRFAYEAKRRNQVDVLDRNLTLLTNEVVRKVDTVAMATLDADPAVKTIAGTDWTATATRDGFGDILRAAAQINNAPGALYRADTVLINPADELSLLLDKSLRDVMPREATTANPYLTGRLNGVAGLTWYASPFVKRGTVYVLQAKAAGSLHDEVPFYTRVTDEPGHEAYLVQAARVTVPVITDPLAVVKVTGVGPTA